MTTSFTGHRLGAGSDCGEAPPQLDNPFILLDARSCRRVHKTPACRMIGSDLRRISAATSYGSAFFRCGENNSTHKRPAYPLFFHALRMRTSGEKPAPRKFRVPVSSSSRGV